MNLLGFVPVWVSQWLTPVWILGVGAVAGFLVLFLLWGLAALLSRIPLLGTLEERPGARRSTVIVLSIILFLVLAPTMVYGAWEEGMPLMRMLTTALVWLIPAAAVAAFVIARGLIALVARRTVSEVPAAVQEGPLLWALIIAGSLAAFAFVGAFAVEQPVQMLGALTELPFSAPEQLEFHIPPSDQGGLDYRVEVDFERRRLERITLSGDSSLAVNTRPAQELLGGPTFEVPAGETVTWDRRIEEVPFTDDVVQQLYIVNRSNEPATLRMTVLESSEYPEMGSVFIMALCVVGVFLAYVLQRAIMPKMSAVALATLKSEIAQPLFPIILIVGAVLVVLFIWIPYNTFGEDIKMLKSSGLTLIMVLGIIQAIWAASTSVADEIDGRTALTVLSKPVTRLSFIVGKYLGIVWTVGTLFLVLGIVFLIVVAYKPIYDAKEGSELTPSWQLCYFEMMRTVPGLVLAFMETAVLAALSVAISTRLPLLANFAICFSIYVLGHITPQIVQSSMEGFEIVKFIGQLIATIFPILEYFNIEAGVAAGVGVPTAYLGWALLYCLIYSVIALLLALVLFEDRDLA